MENRLLNDNELEQAQGGVDTSLLMTLGMLIVLVGVDPNNLNSEQGDLASSTSAK